MAAIAAASVQDVRLSAQQEALLHTLERQVQLRAQAESNALLLQQQRGSSTRAGLHLDSSSNDSSLAGAPTVKAFLAARAAHRTCDDSAATQRVQPLAAFATRVDACVADWATLFTRAHDASALVEEMEASHAQVASKTRALYDSFENVLQQVDALTTRVAVVAAPLPHFTAIDGVARTLGFGVKFAAPSTIATAPATASAQAQQQQTQVAVQVFQHKRGIDPTTPAFTDALAQIDACISYLEQHLEYRDAACYIDAYRTLAAGGIQCLRDYAVSGIDAARDAVIDALARAPSRSSELDEASPYYVSVQLVAPALAAVAVQLERLATSAAAQSNALAHAANQRALADVCDAYVLQRVQLLSAPLAAAFEATRATSDIVNLLRLSCAHLVRVCDAEFRLFAKLFGREPLDAVFVFQSATDADESDASSSSETPFERMLLQLSSLLYNVVRPEMLQQKDLDVLCETIHVLKSEVVESLIVPRAATVGSAAPVMHRMVQDAQERLILCVQKYIRDDIEGFAPTPEDLDYPNKLIVHASGSLYATWYPTLEHTLLCLSKVYRFVNTEIFEELAQDAIQICTASLQMASADVTATRGPVHGTLFLVKHLLTLREQITPFDVTFALTSKALDFTTSADALSHLLAGGTSTIFSLSLADNALVGLFANAMPHIHERTSDVKKELELALKKSCAAFIEAALARVAQPLLALLKHIATAQARAARTQAPIDLRQLHATAPAHVADVLTGVATQLETHVADIRETIHLYLRNASTESILFKPVQRNLLDGVEGLKALMEQTYAPEERAASDAAVARVLAQLHAL